MWIKKCAIVVAVVLLFTACATTMSAIPTAGDTGAVVDESISNQLPDVKLSKPVELIGTGSLEYAENVPIISADAENLILDYMTRYYEGIARLDIPDMDDLFYDKDDSRAVQTKMALEYLVKTRAMQKTDLSLNYYSYKLTVNGVNTDKNGNLVVRLAEDSVQSFAHSPNIESELYDAWHVFTMKSTDLGYKLLHHRDILSWSVIKNVPVYTAMENFEDIEEKDFEKLLEDAKIYVQKRGLEEDTVDKVSTDGEYDRQAAVEYAQRWVSEINSEWENYARYGGNCQNYVSQCLLAGGIPMDTTGSYVWKWYGSKPSESSSKTGRSASWSSVMAFLEYAKSNKGKGLSAQVAAPYYSGEKGDVIHMGTSEDFRHSVVITEVVKDSAGNTIDYLISSNTANYKNFPASAYPYTNQILIKILGYNK